MSCPLLSGVQLKKEFATCGNVAMELPSGHELRVELDDAKKKLEKLMDELLGFSKM